MTDSASQGYLKICVTSAFIPLPLSALESSINVSVPVPLAAIQVWAITMSDRWGGGFGSWAVPLFFSLSPWFWLRSWSLVFSIHLNPGEHFWPAIQSFSSPYDSYSAYLQHLCSVFHGVVCHLPVFLGFTESPSYYQCLNLKGNPQISVSSEPCISCVSVQLLLNLAIWGLC